MYLSGPLRLGIVITVTWLFVATALYLAITMLGAHEIARTAQWAFNWQLDNEALGREADFIPLLPRPSISGFAAIVSLPSLAWIVFYVVPRSIAWIRAGFNRS